MGRLLPVKASKRRTSSGSSCVGSADTGDLATCSGAAGCGAPTTVSGTCTGEVTGTAMVSVESAREMDSGGSVYSLRPVSTD